MEYSKNLNEKIIVAKHASSKSFRLVFGEKNVNADLKIRLELNVKEARYDVVFLFFKELYKWEDRIIKQSLDNIFDLNVIYYLVVGNVKQNLLIEAWENRAFKEHDNWTYCIPLKSNIEYFNTDCDESAIYDLSVCFTCTGWSANIPYSNEGSDYISGGSCCEFWLSDAKRKDLLELMINFGIKSEEYYKEVEEHNGIMKMLMRSNKDYWQLKKFLEDGED